MASRPKQIVFKNAPKMSLNDRFTEVMKTHIPTETESGKLKGNGRRNGNLREKIQQKGRKMVNKGPVKSRLGLNSVKMGNATKYAKYGKKQAISSINHRQNKGDKQINRKDFNLRSKNLRGNAKSGMRVKRIGLKSKAPPSKETLDDDIDQYMSGTKGHLDAQLDLYNAERANSKVST